MSNLSDAETELLIQHSIAREHEKLLSELPHVLRPTMHEVAEEVAHNVELRLGDLLNVDTSNIESKRALRDDLSYLREARKNRHLVQKSFWSIWVKAPVKIIIGMSIASFAYLLGRDSS